MALTLRVEGQTNFGSDRVQSCIAVQSQTGTASGLVLVDTAGNEYVLWVDTSGNVRLSTANTRSDWTDTPNSGGTVIGP